MRTTLSLWETEPENGDSMFVVLSKRKSLVFVLGGFFFFLFSFFLHGVGFCSFVSFRFSKVSIFKTVNLNIEVNFNVKDIK